MKCAVLVPALLLVLPGCDRTLHQVRHTVYVPTQVGLTLIYENPAIEDAGKRFSDRLQVRVASLKDTPDGQLITLTYASLQGQMDTQCLIKDGGWSMVMEDKRLLPILPEGFPDRVSRWERPGSQARVLGRAAAELPGLQLPADFDRIGVWVESESPTGAKRRTLYLAGIGEAESRILKDGKWVCVNRLVSRGTTEAPEVKPVAEPEPKPETPASVVRKAKQRK